MHNGFLQGFESIPCQNGKKRIIANMKISYLNFCQGEIYFFSKVPNLHFPSYWVVIGIKRWCINGYNYIVKLQNSLLYMLYFST